MVPLKYLSKFWRTLEMHLINCEVSLQLKWFKNILLWLELQIIKIGNFCIGFIDFMLKGKSLLEYANLFSPNIYEKNDKIILKYFQ